MPEFSTSRNDGTITKHDAPPPPHGWQDIYLTRWIQNFVEHYFLSPHQFLRGEAPSSPPPGFPSRRHHNIVVGTNTGEQAMPTVHYVSRALLNENGLHRLQLGNPPLVNNGNDDDLNRRTVTGAIPRHSSTFRPTSSPQNQPWLKWKKMGQVSLLALLSLLALMIVSRIWKRIKRIWACQC